MLKQAWGFLAHLVLLWGFMGCTVCSPLYFQICDGELHLLPSLLLIPFPQVLVILLHELLLVHLGTAQEIRPMVGGSQLRFTMDSSKGWLLLFSEGWEFSECPPPRPIIGSCVWELKCFPVARPYLADQVYAVETGMDRGLQSH